MRWFWRLLTERPSRRRWKERELEIATILERCCLPPNLDDCALPHPAQRASELKQEELAARVNNLVNRMQGSMAKADLLWEERERRTHSEPFCGPDKRLVDLGPPIAPKKDDRTH